MNRYLVRQTTNWFKWVKEGLVFNDSPTFANDGTTYLFSTLNPGTGSQGGLRIFSLHQNVSGPHRLRDIDTGRYRHVTPRVAHSHCGHTRVLAALILLGVFIPNTAYQIINLPFWAASAFVLVGWIAYSISKIAKKITLPQTIAVEKN